MDAGPASISRVAALVAARALVVHQGALARGVEHAEVLPVVAEAQGPLADQGRGGRPVAGLTEGVQVVAGQPLDLQLCGRPGRTAMRAQPAHQALRQHPEQGVPEVERVHVHVQQAGHGFSRAVGVQGRQHQVTGQRGLDRHLGRLLVPDLTHHDHIRIGAQQGAKGLVKGPADLRVDLHLPQARLRDLDRVFGRPDLALWHVDQAQRRVQRGGLARARGPHAQEHAVRALDHLLHLGQVVRRHADVAQGHELGRGQQTQHGVFQSAVRGNRRHPQLKPAAIDEFAHGDLAVLRLAPLGNVEVAHDLDPGQHGAAVGVRQLHVGLEHPIPAEPDQHLLLSRLGLDVDVGDALGLGFQDHGVDQPHQGVVRLFYGALLVEQVVARALFQRGQQGAGV